MNNFIRVVCFILLTLGVDAQSIDRIEAIIGDEIVLTSDIESQYSQYLSQGNLQSEIVKCEIYEDVLLQKILINQAKLDSILVSDEDVDTEIIKRLEYFESQLGSVEKVEDYFGKSKIDIETELRKVIKDQFLAQKMQNSISSDIKVTPSEVREFYNKINKDEIPLVPAKVELTQIVIKPKITDEDKEILRAKLNDFRKRVYNGEDFKMLATLYSDDVGSASKGGELGFVNRGDLVPEFERAAFRLKEGEISEVVSSEYGFHLIQLIKRIGEQINVRHILLKNKVSSTALYNAKVKIESIQQEIMDGKIAFEDAISMYSNDVTKNNNGLLLNSNTMSTMHITDDLDPSLKYTVEKLKVNEISKPAIMQLTDGNKAYRIIKLTKRIDTHTANLVDDFSTIKDYAINLKSQEKFKLWIQKTISQTYVKINEGFLECSFKNKWKN